MSYKTYIYNNLNYFYKNIKNFKYDESNIGN